MITTALIAFREFLEAFLIVGVFFGISKKLTLKREMEIGLATSIGCLISLVLACITYFFGDFARGILTEDRAEILQSYLLIFSGFFIVYVIFSLHNSLRKGRGGKLISAHQKLQKNAFDLSLFTTIVMLVLREGFEIALFTASTSLFSVFFQNVLGLLIGFIGAGIVGFLTFSAYLRFSIGKVFKYTEYMIIVLGASLVQNGITELLIHSFNIHIGNILRFPFQFLPSEKTIPGHLLKNLLGVDQEFSAVRLFIMILYIAIIYFLFLRKSNKQAVIF